MPQPADLITSVRRVAELLAEAGVRFHFTGGLVASFYGEPRMTQDIDVVVEVPTRAATEQLISLLSRGFFVDPQSIREGVRDRRWFQALDNRTFIKIDFHVGEDVPGELGRSCQRELIPEVVVPIVSKEDALLSKLLWIRKGSHKSRRDVVMMLRRRGDLDTAYVDRTAHQFGLSDLLDELRQEAAQL